MLEYLNHRNPNLKGYESLALHLEHQFAKKFASNYNNEQDQDHLKRLDESLKHPALHRYWKNTLD
jgi:hypothetical protein